MPDAILSNSSYYTIHLTEAEHKKHNTLLLVGSFMSQLFKQAYCCNWNHSEKEGRNSITYTDFLHEMACFIASGKEHAKRWDNTATEIIDIFKKAEVK